MDDMLQCRLVPVIVAAPVSLLGERIHNINVSGEACPAHALEALLDHKGGGGGPQEARRARGSGGGAQVFHRQPAGEASCQAEAGD